MTSSPASTRPVKRIGDIPGWFPWLDQRVFEYFLSSHEPTQGDLVELGTYLGKSAVLIGNYQRPGETFTVVDLFGTRAGDEDNQNENDATYADLSRAEFERNYLALHDQLPVVIQGLSSVITDHVGPGSVRFMHVDASHLYEHVCADVDSARSLLMPDGVVAFDDFRSVHTPGVSAAVWEAVFTKGLHPICVTTQKLYATFGDSRQHVERVEAWLNSSKNHLWEVQRVAGAPIIRIVEPLRQPSGITMTQSDVEKMSAATAQSIKQLRDDVGNLKTELSRVAYVTGAVNSRMATLETQMNQLRQARGSTVERAMRRAARKWRTKWRRG